MPNPDEPDEKPPANTIIRGMNGAQERLVQRIAQDEFDAYKEANPGPPKGQWDRIVERGPVAIINEQVMNSPALHAQESGRMGRFDGGDAQSGGHVHFNSVGEITVDTSDSADAMALSIRNLGDKYPPKEIPRLDMAMVGAKSIREKIISSNADRALEADIVKSLIAAFAASGEMDELDITNEAEVRGFARGLWKFARLAVAERYSED